jgi:hypothetical protein
MTVDRAAEKVIRLTGAWRPDLPFLMILPLRCIILSMNLVNFSFLEILSTTYALDILRLKCPDHVMQL